MASHNNPDNPDSFLLPDLGEGLEEAVLVEWCVSIGQQIKELDVLAKMETAKAMVDVTSPRDGVIEHLHGQPGDNIKVGAALVSFESSTAEAPEKKPVSAAMAPPADHPADVPESQPPDSGLSISSAPDSAVDSGTVVGTVVGALGNEAHNGGAAAKARAAPAVRRLARDMGVDINQVIGTGTGGRVTSRDVQAAAAGLSTSTEPEVEAVAPSPSPPPSDKPSSVRWPSTQETGLPPRRIPTLQRPEAPTIPPGKESIRIPFRGVRRIIAQHLRRSIGHAVHFTIMDDADITALDEQRRRFTEIARQKVTLLPFIAAAVCRVISGREDPRFNRLNATVDDENQQIIQHRSVHLGVATDTEEGLMVPVIKDADQLGVLDLGRKIQELAKKARERHIKRDEMVGSTFTISNFGSLHGRYGTPIINYPEACILAVGRAREGVIVRDHMIGVGMQLPLSFSADHRVVDGGTAAQALARIIELLQTPQELLSPVA